jgi:hypothetical protein
MNVIKLLMLVGIIGASWNYWHKHQATAATEKTASTNGFISLPAPSGAAPGRVLVIAAENCTADAARRADDLAYELSKQKIPVTRSHNVNFEFSQPDAGLMQRLNTVMNGELPIVFVGDRARNNPTLAEVVAEYRN